MTSGADTALAASRPLSVAKELGSQELEPGNIFSKVVVLTGESDVLATNNGRWCFIDALRLLARVVGDLRIVLPKGVSRLHAEVDELLQTLWSQGTVRPELPDAFNWAGADAVLNVGIGVRPELPWTSVIANGWVARCTSGKGALPAGCWQENPISCMLAASLGVTEVFKRVYGVPYDKAPPMEGDAFSLFEWSTDFQGLGPQLPEAVHLPNTLLLGAGAIGNGLVLLASQLSLNGRMLVMDKQNFGDENYGTCTLLDVQDWLNEPKAIMLAGWLDARSELGVTGLKSTIEDAEETGSLNSRNIDLVINGLDDIDARRAVQALWPRLTVDGAINSAGAAVVTYSLAHRDLACLRCAFDLPKKDLLATQSELTGLSRASLEGDPNRPITDKDIADAAEAARPFLKEQQRLGGTICSTMEAAQAAGLGLKLKSGFRPSVPFVATAAAAFVWAQVFRNLLWPNEPFVHTCQMASLFLGPHTSRRYKRMASTECECSRHASVIDRLVASRP